jgi:hypothetical protein
LTLLLHTHLKGERNTYREHATWKWFERYDKEIEAEGWDIAHVEITPGKGHEYDYDGVLRHFWGKDDLVIFERDMVPSSFESLKILASCPELSCSIDYPLIRCWAIELVSKSHRNLVRQGVASRIVVCVAHKTENSMMRDNGSELLDVKPDGRKVYEATWNDGTWTHADMAPLGLTRFKKELMQRIPAGWPPTNWLELDGIVTASLSMNGVRTHIHLPMAKHMRKRNSMLNHDLVATIPLDTPVAFLTDLKPEYQWIAKKRFAEGMNHAMRPLVEVQ